jgi:hypothetical protein
MPVGKHDQSLIRGWTNPESTAHPHLSILSNFANPLLHSLCNQFTDAIANGRMIEHWIELVRWKQLLRYRMTARTITVRFLG